MYYVLAQDWRTHRFCEIFVVVYILDKMADKWMKWIEFHNQLCPMCDENEYNNEGVGERKRNTG